MDLDEIKYDENGLVPVIVQDAENGQVLMFAYANRESLKKTIETGRTHFWSRSRRKLWMKGEESGNVQEVRDMYFDCDSDTVLILVSRRGSPATRAGEAASLAPSTGAKRARLRSAPKAGTGRWMRCSG